MRIKLAQIFVDDQDRAQAFYSAKVGFLVKSDAAYGPGARWLTVASPEDPDGIELLLSVPSDAAKAFQAGQRSHGTPATSFATDDCQKTYEELTARGVTFTLPPTKMDYGGIDAVFDDTCGNLINVHQA